MTTRDRPPSADPGRARFGLVIAAIGGSYVAVIACGAALASGLLRIGLLGLVLVTAVRLHRRSAGRTRMVAGAVAIVLVADAVSYRTGSTSTTLVLTSLAIALLVIASAATIARYLWRRPNADRQTVGGALAVYLLLALLFSSIHQLLAVLLGVPYLNGVPTATDAAAYLYFSVVTLTTVGYGDLTPGCHAAQAVAITEALAGQLYLVAVVGAVVGNWAGQVRTTRDPNRAGDTDA